MVHASKAAQFEQVLTRIRHNRAGTLVRPIGDFCKTNGAGGLPRRRDRSASASLI